MKIKSILIVAAFALAFTGASAQLTLGPVPAPPMRAAQGPLTSAMYTAMVSDLPVPSGKTCTHATVAVQPSGYAVVSMQFSDHSASTDVITSAQFAAFLAAGNALPSAETTANVKMVSIGEFILPNGSTTPPTELVDFSQ